MDSHPVAIYIQDYCIVKGRGFRSDDVRQGGVGDCWYVAEWTGRARRRHFTHLPTHLPTGSYPPWPWWRSGPTSSTACCSRRRGPWRGGCTARACSSTGAGRWVGGWVG